jgi:RNA polymerase sigma-70 factor (ECF subfamily)
LDKYNDQELVLSAQNGDLAAFETLVRQHGPALYAFIYRLVGDPTDADELTQETWVKAWRSLSGFKGKSEFKTWLFRIGMNLTFNWKKRRKPVEELTELLPGSSNNEPVTVFEQKRREEVVKAALAQLPPDQRTALVLNIYEGMSYREVAEVMGRSVRAVDALLFRAKANLRQILIPARRKGIV